LNHVNQNKGILAGLIAGVFWGTPFLVPMLLSNFSAFEITFGRFFFFGIVSLIFLPRVIRVWKQLNWLDLLNVFVLSAAGFWLYTLVLFYGVQLTGGVTAALIIGCLPLTITLFSSPHFNAKLWLGLSLILIGLLCLVVWPLVTNRDAFNALNVNIVGVIVVFVALVLWTYFSIRNSHFMVNHIHIKSLDYSSLIGLINLICMLPAFALLHGFSSILDHPHFWSYLFWCAVLGLGASWIANIFWAYSAKICPASIVGSLIVSETVFGLLYGFMFEKRLPHVNETIAISTLILGVILSIRSQIKRNV
jgi:drug/metabolite transporter (DMT)-like permease